MIAILKWIPIAPYVLTTAGLVSTLALFMALKREIRRQAQRQKARVEEMAFRLREAERPPEPSVALVPAPARAGLNLNKRVHAMRMLRRGEDIGHVAAALGVSRREVELLIRVQSIGKTRAAQAGTD